MITVGFLLTILALILGALFALYLSVHQSLRELAMLYGVGGWAGRIAVLHLLVWSLAVFWLGPRDDSWIVYGAITIAMLGTVAGPFYLNNRAFLEAAASHRPRNDSRELLDTESSLVPISGTVVIEDVPTKHDAEIDPLTAPFTASACAAYEWAVKRRQRLSRRRTYTTVDSGQTAGTFMLDTGEDLVRVEPEDPRLLLVFDVGVTGYESTLSNPSAETPRSSEGGSSTVFDDMRYCETTISDGDPVTVVGGLSHGTDGTPRLADPESGRMYVLNAEFERIHRIVDRYLRWTPHVGLFSILASWGYVTSLVVV